MKDFIINSELIDEWDWEKNNELGLYPDQLTLGSGKKAWWKCKLGHEWFAELCSRSSGKGCPYCSNRIILEGFNDLFTTHKELCNEWDYEKNDILPTQISAGSSKKVWWVCNLGHSYSMAIHNRTHSNNGCPYCAGKKILIGFNDLNTVNPKLASEWNYQKNGNLTPDMVTSSSGKVVWWKCNQGHEWQRRIASRNTSDGCPYCADYYVWAGYNDLTTTRPDLVVEWDYDKNENILPTQISRGYGDKVWWKCKKCGHSWEASPNSRDSMGSGCPECSKGRRTSSQEMKLYYYIKTYFDDAIQSYSDQNINLSELDIYIPSLHVGIEYDGAKWHSDIERDKNKDEICFKNCIKLIRIREPKCPIYESNCIFIYLKNMSQKELSDAFYNILCMIGIDKPDIDFDRDINEINSFITYSYITNSLAVQYPEIASTWHPTKNGNLTPNNVLPKSDKRVWWICSQCGNEWVTSVKTRTRGSGCSECGKIKSGVNRRKTANDFIEELKYINDTITTSEYIRAKDKISVQCKTCGFEWLSTPANLLRGKGCPKCAMDRTRESRYVPVYCPELNCGFKSEKEASDKTGINYNGINRCINGKQKYAGKHPITGEKLTWRIMNFTVQN